MRKIFIITALSAVSLLLADCSPKTAKTVSAAPVKTETDKVAEVKKNFSEVQLAEGKTIFEGKCGSCHRLKMPETFGAAEWEPILLRMNAKARLDEKQAALVRAYVLANTKA